MLQKFIYILRRITILLLEVIGLLAVLAVIAWGVLLWRLSQGPLDVGFLTDRLERALNIEESGFLLNVEDTLLVWEQNGAGVEVMMRGVHITREDKTPVLVVGKIAVQLSKRHLVFGQLVPKVITIHAPALRVIRWEDGHFSLNISGLESRSPESIIPDIHVDQDNEVDEDMDEDRVKIVRGLLQKLRENQLGVIGGLREVRITGASILYEDKNLDVVWRSRQSRVVFARRKNDLIASTDIILQLAPDQQAIFRANASYDWASESTVLIMAFQGVVPSLIAQESENLVDIAQIKTPLQGSIALELTPEFIPTRLRYILNGSQGAFNVPGLFPAPVDIQKMYLSGIADLQTLEGELQGAMLDFGGPRVRLSGSVKSVDDGHAINLSGQIESMPVNSLKTYWPTDVSPSARQWITTRLSKGMIPKTTMKAALKWEDDDISVQSLNGTMNVQGMTVDYFPPLKTVENANGQVEYNEKTFNISVQSGDLGDMKVTGGDIEISGLDIEDVENIDIKLDLSGPLKTALSVLDSEPLRYPSKMDIEPDTVKGQADLNLSFQFPLLKDLKIEQVKIAAKAKLDDVFLKDVVKTYALTGGPMSLFVDNNHLDIKGDGFLGSMPTSFDWTRNFDEAPDIPESILNAKVVLNQDAMHTFGAPEFLDLRGQLPSNIQYTTQWDNTALLTLNGDLKQTSFGFDPLGYKKNMGEDGEIAFSLNLKDGQAQRMSGLNVAAKDARVMGALAFRKGEFYSADFSRLILGRTNVSASVERDASIKGYSIKAKGNQADVTSILQSSRKNEGKESVKSADDKSATPIKLSADVDTLLTGEESQIDRVKFFLFYDENSRIEQFELDGMTAGDPVYWRFLPDKKGGYTLRFEADNAGAAMRAAGIMDTIRGGKIIVSGASLNNTDHKRDLAGKILFSNFTVVDAPALARLLNALSLTGMAELVSGKGIAFRKLRAKYTWLSRDPPSAKEKIRFLKLEDGKTFGSSLGLTFGGNVDIQKGLLDLDGTIVPVSDLSDFVSSIPLVGDVLTAGGEGLFAATYTFKGPRKNPKVTVNPLAALAPGVLRKMFFED